MGYDFLGELVISVKHGAECSAFAQSIKITFDKVLLIIHNP